MKNKPRIIADTCVWIEFFRTKSETSNRLKNFIVDNLIVSTGLVLAELLQGARKVREREIIIDALTALDYLEITRDIWIEAGNLAQELRANGKTIPLSDLVLACCARKHQHHIFTFDKHFQDIPDIMLI